MFLNKITAIMRSLSILISFLAISALTVACGSGNNADTAKSQEIWGKIETSFVVPQEFQGDFGEFSSPLVFDNGQEVKNPADWERRREEILTRWHGMMGQWPELLVDQEFEIIDSQDKEDYVLHTVKFNWLPGEPTQGYLLVPEGEEPKPAVISVYYQPEAAAALIDTPYRDYAHQLAKRGFVTLSIGTSETTDNRTYSLYYPNRENAEIQPLSTLAYAAANAWNVLANVDGVDSTRIGIIGHSYGGKWALFASTLYEKFAAAAWSDPGIVFDDSRRSVNYWEPWYLGYYPPPWDNTWRSTGAIEDAKGLYPELRERNIDLTDLHALMAPRPFLVSGGSEDPPERWKALNHSIAVNELLGYENRVAMTNRPEHTPNEEANEQIYLFFEYFLKYNNLK